MALRAYGVCGIMPLVAWDVEYTDEFGSWWNGLSADEQDSVNFGVRLLQERGPNLKRPFADTIAGSRYPNMKELRCQHQGRPYRVLYAFDPRRTGIFIDWRGQNRQAELV